MCNPRMIIIPYMYVILDEEDKKDPSTDTSYWKLISWQLRDINSDCQDKHTN